MSMNFKHLGFVNFPQPQGICINMMPFIMGDPQSIPEEYRHFYPLVEACSLSENQIGKVGYLSVTESQIVKGNSHRRGGVHVEKHPTRAWGGGGGWGGGTPSVVNPIKPKPVPEPLEPLPSLRVEDGLYMASNVADSCKVWDHNVEVPGVGGSCEHLIDKLGQGVNLKKNELIWISDSCPHESLIVDQETYRQWFRLVTHKVDLWFVDKSTANRLGVKPACIVI
jgi:hypothetical protein